MEQKKKYVVTTQKEMDAVPYEHNGWVEVRSNELIKVSDDYSCRLEVYGKSEVEVCGNITVEAFDNTTVYAFGNSSVELYDNATANPSAHGQAKIKVHDKEEN